MKEIKHLLKPFGLKLSLPRLKVLELFLSTDKAITYSDLLQLTEKVFDRVTIYRTLKTFEDAGIIHRIVGANSSVNYALTVTSDKKKPHQQHLHFSCTKCHSIYCLNDQLVPPIALPDNYEVHSLSLIITGTCRLCNEC